MNNLQSKKNSAWLIFFLGWLIYSTSYLGKVNYSANITQIIDFYGVTKSQAGLVPTFFFFAYGIGQVVNGLFCSKYNIKWMIFLSLVTSATINLIIAISTNFSIVKWLWLLNGLSLSVLWPTIVRMLSENLPEKALSTSSVIMGTTVATGTLIIYALSSVFAAFDNFKLAFYTAAFSAYIASFFWLFFYNKAVSLSSREKENEELREKEIIPEKGKTAFEKNEKKLFYISVLILCFCAVGVNLIKDGLTTWVPSILKEEFSLTDSLSILLTLFLPVLAVFGNVFALSAHKKIPDYIHHCTLFFAIMFIFIGIIIGSLSLKLVLFMLISLIVVNFLASSLNSLITSIYPLFMRDKVNSGLFAGILNGFCYVGSTISSYGLGMIADNWGWTAVFWTLMSFCILTFLVWTVYVFFKIKLSKN